MSLRRIIILGLLVAFIIGAMASTAFMATQQTNAQSDKVAVAGPAAQKPNLTDEQKAKIKSIIDSAKQKAQSVKVDKTLSDEDKKAKIRAIHEDAKNQLRGLLTPEQQKKLSALKQKFGAKRHPTVWARNRWHPGFHELTDDQRARVKSILEGARKDIEKVKNNASFSDQAKQQQIRNIREAAKAKVKEYLESQGIKPRAAIQKPMAGARHRSPAKFAAGCWKQLGLTEDQKAKIQEIRKSTYEQLKALKADASLTPDAKKAKAREIIQAQRSQIREVLTPEQQKKFDQNTGKKHSSPNESAESKQNT